MRSIHPTHSVALIGENASWLAQGHEECDTPCGRGTPYQRLIEVDASVLMFGATMNTYTLFHTAEDVAGCEYLYEETPYNLRARDLDGVVHDVRMWRQNMKIDRRFEDMHIELETAGLLRRSRLGLGEVLFIPSAANVHRYLLARLTEDPMYLVAEGARPSLMKRG